MTINMELIITLLGFIGFSGIVSGLVLRRIDKMDKKMDKQSEAKKQENVIIISGLKAIGHLSEANAIALKNGHTNGETETAIGYYKKFTDELGDYLVQQNAEKNYGR